MFARAGQPFIRSGLPLLIGMALTFGAVATLAAIGGGWAVQANQVGRWIALVVMAVLGLTLVFPSLADKDKPMSNMAMLSVLRRMRIDAETTVHGVCRASFSSWANECGVARPDVVEAALAHREADRVRAAYNRASFDSERRDLLAAWANYCDGKVPKSVVLSLIASPHSV